MHRANKPLFSYRKYWAHRFGSASVLPMSKKEMDDLGWDSCDVILVSGDAYVDHPSFGMAVIGRVLEAQGFRVGIISQPDWRDTNDFKRLGKPNLFFGVTAGNMDSMVNRYTADRKIRSNDAYTPNGEGGSRPDRSVIVYSQRCRQAYRDVPLVIGGIEASLRRIAHYDYWSDKVRRSALIDAKADLLVFGNGERQVVEIAHRLGRGEDIAEMLDIRGTAVVRKELPAEYYEINPTLEPSARFIKDKENPYLQGIACDQSEKADLVLDSNEKQVRFLRDIPKTDRGNKVYIRLPAFDQVKSDKIKYAQTSRVLHLETNPGNAHALVQRHGDREVWLNPPPEPLTTSELDGVFDLPFTRRPHPSYGNVNIPAYEMIRFSVNIMRGCFGGCTFCSITEHEGRIIQSRSEKSILKEIESIRDTVPGFTGFISDLGGPTANMYRLNCKDENIEKNCRRLSCVYPGICKNLNTNHRPLIELYRNARKIKGVKKIVIASGLRYDLAIEDPEYIKELVSHHVGGYLKIAPEHTENGPLSKMMKPGIGTYDRFKELFERYSAEAGKEQYLIPYFIAAHPGTSDEDMMNLALWLKKNGFRADQVQTFLPSPMAMATTMYHTQKNPLSRVRRTSESVQTARGLSQRRLHKAFLRYHDPENWDAIRNALHSLGRDDLIGKGKSALVPAFSPASRRQKTVGHKVDNESHIGSTKGRTFRTQHTGLSPEGASAGISKSRTSKSETFTTQAGRDNEKIKTDSKSRRRAEKIRRRKK